MAAPKAPNLVQTVEVYETYPGPCRASLLVSAVALSTTTTTTTGGPDELVMAGSGADQCVYNAPTGQDGAGSLSTSASVTQTGAPPVGVSRF